MSSLFNDGSLALFGIVGSLMVRPLDFDSAQKKFYTLEFFSLAIFNGFILSLPA
jgi:hypothetical protein